MPSTSSVSRDFERQSRSHCQEPVVATLSTEVTYGGRGEVKSLALSRCQVFASQA